MSNPEPADVVDWADPLRNEPFTEVGIAERLIHRFGHKHRFVPEWGQWLYFDGTRWVKDKGGVYAVESAKLNSRAVLVSLGSIESDAKKNEAMKAWQKAESARGIDGVLSLVKRDLRIAVTSGQLDQDPWLLNTPAGVYDLRTGEFTPGHRPEDLMTKLTRGLYDPEASSAVFDAFLRRIQPDEAMRAFLGRLLSQGLSGSITENILPIFYGSGANGKTTLTEAVRNALGDYAQTVDPELLIDKSNKHLTGVADLLGCRLALAAETEANENLAESTVKRLTGGDTLKARYMRQDLFEFTPTHTLIMSTNHRPKVKGQDEGIWRRLKLIPFDVQIPAAEQDPELSANLELAADSILLWLIRGYADYQQNGLQPPQIVEVATSEYRNDENALTRWIGEACDVDPTFEAQSSELYASWSKWCMNEGVPSVEHLSVNKFAKALEQIGYTVRRTKTGSVRCGLRLKI